MKQKQERRNMRGETFNAFVLTREPLVRGKIQSSDELQTFINELKTSLDQGKFAGTTKFQLAVYNKEKNHWTAFDVLIKENNLNVLCVDAASDISGDDTLALFKKAIPSCSAYLLEPDKLPSNKDRRRIIQSDNESCSRMTIEHISILSKNDLLQKLTEKKIDNLNSEDCMMVTPMDVLPLAPALYRSTQSWKTIDSFETSLLQLPVSSTTGLTLKQYALANSEPTPEKPGAPAKSKPDLINKAINNKRIKYAIKFLDFFEKHGESIVKDTIRNHATAWKTFLKQSSIERELSLASQVTRIPLTEVVSQVIDKRILANNTQLKLQDERYRNFQKTTPSLYASMIAREATDKLKEIGRYLTAVKNEMDKLDKNMPPSKLKDEIKKNIAKIINAAPENRTSIEAINALTNLSKKLERACQYHILNAVIARPEYEAEPLSDSPAKTAVPEESKIDKKDNTAHLDMKAEEKDNVISNPLAFIERIEVELSRDTQDSLVRTTNPTPVIESLQRQKALINLIKLDKSTPEIHLLQTRALEAVKKIELKIETLTKVKKRAQDVQHASGRHTPSFSTRKFREKGHFSITEKKDKTLESEPEKLEGPSRRSIG